MAALPAETILALIDGDFRASWDALATVQGGELNRGNFMFAFQAFLLLEVACRCCSDESRRKLGTALKSTDPRYFTKLPGRAPSPDGFQLPECGTDPSNRLLYAMFDVVRNGPAHQYQPMLVTLEDGMEFHVRLTGPAFGATLAAATNPAARADHLRVGLDEQQNLWLDVRTDILFLDISAAVTPLDLPTRTMRRLAAPAPGKHHYRYDSTRLLTAFAEGGHSIVTPVRLPSPSLAPRVYFDMMGPKKT